MIRRPPRSTLFPYNDALPIWVQGQVGRARLEHGQQADHHFQRTLHGDADDGAAPDRKSTRLNSSHSQISYAVFCLKKKKTSVYDAILLGESTRTESRCVGDNG